MTKQEKQELESQLSDELRAACRAVEQGTADTDAIYAVIKKIDDSGVLTEEVKE